MPHWTEQLIEPPWAKDHAVSLKEPAFYEQAAARGGSDRIRRHDPLSRAGGHDRKAGTSGKHQDAADEQESESHRPKPDDSSVRDREQVHWEHALEDGSKVVSVRDVKNAVPDYKLLHPKNHAFARYVLPIASDAFGKQNWPGKKADEAKDDMPPAKGAKVQPQLSSEEQKMRNRLLEEMETRRNFENNVAKPDGELKPLDSTALQQLESRLSIEDQMTPDSWVPRSEQLVRLAGPHPLNAEVDLQDLFEAGIITPTKLHYVRSHGPVPQLNWETHRLAVFSDPPELIADPKNWAMDELAGGDRFKIVEMPITFACDGNRRKEMSMTKQSSGISFSASGVSTCVWRGVFVRDVLLASGLQDQPDHERWFVNFEGADNCSEGYYATSIPLIHVMDQTNDVMLAFGMNGRVLHPDHGYPLRVIIPGYVGGRQVKWVHKIWITKEPNNSHYHIWDNRVLPSFITTREDPLASMFYHHENTACYEQTLQSVICKPSHNEFIELSSSSDSGDAKSKTYTVQGFAYNGGGTEIARVEVTLDGGRSWKYCFKQYVSKPLRHGEKQWAWIFWSCEIPLQELAEAEEICVRATDARFQVQPENIAWNMLGMMNNSWYRIRPVIQEDEGTRSRGVLFMHPVTNRKEDDGWMRPQEPPSSSESSHSGSDSGYSTSEEKTKTFSLEEIAKHDGQNGEAAWLIIENKVYDVTSVLDWHPGGAAALLGVAGKATVDTTIQYKQIHDDYANSKRDECFIGVLTEEAVEEMKKDAERAAQALAKVKQARQGLTLQPDNFTRAVLIKRTEVSHDTRTYQFRLPKDDGSGSFKLDIGKHVMISVHFNNQAVVRAYTPIAPVLPSEEDGTFTLCVKTYFPTEEGPFPPGGLISNYLDCMKEGEEIDVRGPVGEIHYKGKGDFEIDGHEYHFEKINLVAGGTGITPHWQLIHAILSDEEDATKISMIDCNKACDDILLREELDKYADQFKGRFKLWHAVSKAPEDENWKYGEGHLCEQLMRDNFYAPDDGAVVTLLCGPPGLIEKGAIPGLEKIGFEQGKNIFGF